jgi:hypothetical protein
VFLGTGLHFLRNARKCNNKKGWEGENKRKLAGASFTQGYTAYTTYYLHAARQRLHSPTYLTPVAVMSQSARAALARPPPRIHPSWDALSPSRLALALAIYLPNLSIYSLARRLCAAAGLRGPAPSQPHLASRHQPRVNLVNGFEK